LGSASIISAFVIIIADHWCVDASRSLIARVLGARVPVIAVDCCVDASAGGGIASVNGASILVIAVELVAWVATRDGYEVTSSQFVAVIVGAWVVISASDKAVDASYEGSA